MTILSYKIYFNKTVAEVYIHGSDARDVETHRMYAHTKSVIYKNLGLKQTGKLVI